MSFKFDDYKVQLVFEKVKSMANMELQTGPSYEELYDVMRLPRKKGVQLRKNENTHDGFLSRQLIEDICKWAVKKNHLKMVKKGNKQMYLPGKISKADLLIDAISKKKHMNFLVELPNFEQKEQWNEDDWLNIVLMKENLIRIFFEYRNSSESEKNAQWIEQIFDRINKLIKNQGKNSKKIEDRVLKIIELNTKFYFSKRPGKHAQRGERTRLYKELEALI